MGLTTLETYIGAISIFLLLVTGVIVGGNALINRGDDLTNDSIDYLGNFTQQYKNNDLDEYLETTIYESGQVDYLKDDEEGGASATEIVGLYKTSLSTFDKFSIFIKTSFNLPIIVLSGMLLDPGQFTWALSIAGVALAIYIGIMMAKATNLGGRTK